MAHAKQEVHGGNGVRKSFPLQSEQLLILQVVPRSIFRE